MKNIKIIFSFILLLVLSLSIYGCKDDSGEKFSNAYITIDINPSIEIITNDEGLVEQVNPLNYDAEILLSESDFTGKTVEEVVEAIMNLALEAGYIIEEDENAIIITAETDDEKSRDKLDTVINDTIGKFKEKHKLRMELYKENQRATPELKALAEELNISVGKLKIINKAMEVDTELTLEEASKMSVKDLNNIIKESRKELKEFGNNFKYQYLYAKAKIKQTVRFKKVELIYGLMMEKDESFFTPILENSNASVEDIKNLYKEYYEELKFIKDTYDVGTLINELKEDEDFVNLFNEKQTLLEQKTNLIKEYRKNKEEVRDELNDVLNQIKDINNQFRLLIKEKIEAKLQNKIDFNYYIDEDFTIQINLDCMKLINQTKEKYEALFLELNINLEELEELFEEEIKDEFQQFRDELETKLKEMKEKAKTEKKAYKEQLKLEKEIKKDIFKNNKNDNKRKK